MKLEKIDFIRETEKRYDPQQESLLKGKKVNPMTLESPERGQLRIGHLIENRFEPFVIARERIQGKNDLMSINYLLIGFLYSFPVCRIHVKNEFNTPLGFGTGFLISQSLLITNNHVLENISFAKNSLAEFNYQYDEHGNPADTALFDFQPNVFFTTNIDLDYTVVAVKPRSRDNTQNLSDFGYLKLFEDPAKALLTENLSIIQHPGGGYKQVAIRENQLVTSNGHFVTYTTDTTQGSSGAGVFNDQWQIVALHHSGVPRKDDAGNWLSKDGTIWDKSKDESLIDWVSNEGVRISSIVSDLRGAYSEDPLFKEILDAVQTFPSVKFHNPNNHAAESEIGANTNPIVEKLPESNKTSHMQQQSISFTVPVEITVKIGDGSGAAIPTPVTPQTSPALPVPAFEVRRSVDQNYRGRKGYSPDFISNRHFKIELDELLSEQADKLAPILNPTEDNKHQLKYHNFSVVINKHRRLCVLTAVNIDGTRSESPTRENTSWVLDPRMDARYQTGPAVYASNDLDRGHMVRRLDPVWGPNAEAANDDTFHFSNSAPQHKNLNQKTWLKLEDYILKAASGEGIKVSVFTGPVFGNDDISYRGVLLPLKFWKVAAMIKDDGSPSVTGYILSQPPEIDDFRTLEGISEDGFGSFLTYQVPLKEIAGLTGLSFDKYAEYDPLAGVGPTESVRTRQISSETDIIL